MKTLTFAVVALAAFVSTSVFAEGSKIDKSALINASSNKNVLNAAIGKNATANTGSISVVGSQVSKSAIINASSNKNVLNAAIGEGTVANTGSIDIR